MNDELEAAALRLMGRDLSDYQGPTGDDTDMRAGIMLARAYLAALDTQIVADAMAAEDSLPVTEEWLLANGFIKEGAALFTQSFYWVSMQIRLKEKAPHEVFVNGGVWTRCLVNIGPLRRLIDALEVK